MKKLNTKVIGILGTVALALGVFAIPAFAETTNPNTIGTGNMQSIMASGTMQKAMATGDVTKMTEAMNTPEIKAIMGEEHVNQMTEQMKNGNGMMSGKAGSMMGGTTGSNMMGGFGTQTQQ